VAIKIDRVDSKKFSPETATKSYVEVHNLYRRMIGMSFSVYVHVK